MLILDDAGPPHRGSVRLLMVTITSTIACLRCLPVRCHCRVLWVGCRLQEERPSPAPTNARDEWKLTAASKKAFSKGLWRFATSRGTQITSGISSRINSREMAASSGARTADRLGHSVPSSADTEVRLLAPSRRRRPAPLAGRREGGREWPPRPRLRAGTTTNSQPGVGGIIAIFIIVRIILVVGI